MNTLKEIKADSIKVICGGVIPPQDYEFLERDTHRAIKEGIDKSVSNIRIQCN